MSLCDHPSESIIFLCLLALATTDTYCCLFQNVIWKRSEYVDFCVWLHFTSNVFETHVAAYSNSFVFYSWVVFYSRIYYTLANHSPKIWVVSSFCQLWVALLYTSIYRSVWRHILSFTLVKYLGKTTQFPKWLYHLALPSNMLEFHLLHIIANIFFLIEFIEMTLDNKIT